MACQYTANNIISENGEQFIPASQRPDGTWRKARRVKEGYVPQEEVPLYESKGKQIMAKKQQTQSSIVLPTGQVAKRPIPGLFIIEDEKLKKAPKKKSQQSKVDELNKLLQNTKLTAQKPMEKIKKTDNSKKGCSKPLPTNSEAGTTDPVKKLKNLKKRLREVEALEEKIKSGAVKPEPDQITKVNRKNGLLQQIKELEEIIIL